MSKGSRDFSQSTVRRKSLKPVKPMSDEALLARALRLAEKHQLAAAKTRLVDEQNRQNIRNQP